MNLAPACQPVVLVVDDSPTIRARLVAFLAANGFRTLEAGTAAEARRLVRSARPDVVVLDVVLPDRDGVSLCREWQTDQDTQHTPVLLMSGQRLEALDQATGLEAGALGYVTKPFDDLVLLAQVRTLLRLHRAQRLLHDREEQITAIAEATQDGLIMLGGNGVITYWNQAAERMFGYNAQEAVGAPLHKLLLPPALHDRYLEQLARFNATGRGNLLGRTVEIHAWRRDGSTFPVELSVSATRLRGSWCAVGVIRDHSERAVTAAALERERRKLLSVFDSIDEPIYVADPITYELLYANQAFKRLWPWNGQPGHKCHQVLQGLGEPCPFCTNPKIFADPGGEPYIWEFQNRKTQRWFRCIDRAIEWPNGALVRCELAIDVTDRHEAERALRDAHEQLEERVEQRTAELAEANTELRHQTDELLAIESKLRDSERRYRLLIETMNDGLVVIDERSHCTYVNQRICEMLGYTAQEMLGQPVARFMDRSHRGTFREQLALRRLGQNPAYEIAFCRKDGSKLVCRISPQGLREPDGRFTGSFAVITDVTEQRRHEAELVEAKNQAEQALRDLDQAHSQLLQSDKLASIGQLAAGVAHEINNPMAFISSNLNSLGDYLEDLRRLVTAQHGLLDALGPDRALPLEQLDEVRRLSRELDVDYILGDLTSLVTECIDGAQRVREIVADLKEFSHVDAPECHEIDINSLLDKTINVAWNELKYKAEVRREYGEVPAISGYGGKLGQVLLNLLVNAAQALVDRGTITVRTGVRDDHVWIEIEDTGCGMPPEVQARIFEPFYTTKEPGKGTGLGLHLTYSIVSAHGGTIQVASTPGEGSTFHLELPIAGPRPAPAPEEEALA